MTTQTTVLDPEQALEVLGRPRATPNPVLSTYIPLTLLGDGEEARQLEMRQMARRMRSGLTGRELAQFNAAVDRCESLLTEQTVTYPGIALFDVGDEAPYIVGLPYAVEPALYWQAEPVTAMLKAIADDYERIAVVLCDKERGRLLLVHLNKLESHQEITDEVPGRQSTGGWFALMQTRFDRHREAHVAQHVERVIEALQQAAQEHPFDRLFLGGPPEALAMLREHLPHELAHKVAGTVHVELFAGDAEVVEAVRQAAQTAERTAELDLVHALQEAAVSRSAVMGVEPTLEALHERRVHQLVVAQPLRIHLGQCASCGRLTTSTTQCPSCGSLVTPKLGALETLVAAAEAQGASVEYVSGDAAAALMAAGGIAARTRF